MKKKTPNCNQIKPNKKKAVESIINWTTIPEHMTYSGVVATLSALHWRKLIFPLSTSINDSSVVSP